MKAKPVSEKVEQQHGVQLLRTLGSVVFVLGTVRPRGDTHHGTCQTPGLPDIFCFLPMRTGRQRRTLWWEVKRQGGRLRPEQLGFQQLCRESDTLHIVGPFDALIATLITEGYLNRHQVPAYRTDLYANRTADVGVDVVAGRPPGAVSKID